MLRAILFLGFLIAALCGSDLLASDRAAAATWYFSATGSESTGNGSPTAPWVNPGYHNAVYQPGDTLSVGPGTYTPQWGWGLTASGSAAGGYITLQCAPDFGSHIVVTTKYMHGISLLRGASYWRIRGCDVMGSGLEGGGIVMGGSFSPPYGPVHHIIVELNAVHGASCGGIGAAGNTNGGQPLDYIVIRQNLVWQNATSASYDCSGIAIYEPVAYDTAPGYHIMIQQNISYSNMDCGTCHAITTDGNGIILDDFQHTQNPGPAYTQASLVENNVVFDNGGVGIHVFLSNNAMIRNNTVWGDLRDPKHCYGGSEIDSIMSHDVSVVNNIAQATTASLCNVKTYAIAENTTNIATGDKFDWNIAYGAGGNNAFIGGSPGFAWGAHNKIGVSPNLTATLPPATYQKSDVIKAAFIPKLASPALKAGSIAAQPVNDMLGTPRRGTGFADLGAIQVGK